MLKFKSYFILIPKIFIIFVLGFKSMILSAKQPVDYVNPFIGTDASVNPTKWGAFGGTFPGAVVPHGMVQISPETRISGNQRGYVHGDPRIVWFSLVDHPSGFPNGSAGHFKLLPAVNESRQDAQIPGIPFDPATEFATPGYYRVQLANDILVEFTVTAHAGFCRFTFPPASPRQVILFDCREKIPQNQNSFSGKSRRFFFHWVSSAPFTCRQDGEISVLSFGAGSELSIKIGFSASSPANAEKNLAQEIPDWNFDAVRNRARHEWNNALSQIELEGGSEDQRTNFYTAWYHSLLIPLRVSDIGAAEYSHFSPWDTFRTLHPLLCLLQPQLQGEMLASLLRSYPTAGEIPDWPMSGNHIVAIFADSYLKGIPFDVRQAYALSRELILNPANPEKSDLFEYAQQGFVSAAWPESVSHTLEYAYDDWALAQLARELGETADFELFSQRALNFRNVFHPESRLMRAKTQTGDWIDWDGFEEGDTWDYSWFVPHNLQDLINLMGGDAAFAAQLDRIFTEGRYLHDNEPPLQCAWLFNYAGVPWKTQQRVREILNTKYLNCPGGLPGNDDLGALSSWYIFGALGIYPVCPGRPEYGLGSPLFPKAVLHLENGRDFTIIAPGASAENQYIQSARLNGKPFNQCWISHAAILAGGKLEFELGPAPNPEWGRMRPASETCSIPKIHLESLRMKPNVVLPHEPVDVEIELHNSGATGSQPIDLQIDGTPTQSKWVKVDSNQTQIVFFSVRLYAPGMHSMTVGNAKGLLEVIPPPAGSLPQFEYLQFEVTPLVKAGTMVHGGVRIQNISGIPGTTPVEFQLNGVPVTGEKITLVPGETRWVTFEQEIPVGKHRLAVGNLPALPLKVYREPLESAILQLPLDEKSGELFRDESGLENHARIMGQITSLAGGIKFTENGYLEIPLRPGLEIQGDSLTLMLWLYPNHEETADFFTQGDWTVIKLQYSGRVLSFFAGGWGRGECRTPVPDNWNGQWHHIAGVCAGDELRVFIDGELVQSTKVFGSLNPVPFPWNIGQNGEKTMGRRLKGAVADTRIYPVALSPEEIQQVLKQGNRGCLIR
jgi:putative alpha-1,2-mannosidase